MKVDNYFNFKRCYLYLKKELVVNKSGIMIFAITLSAFLLLYGLIYTANSEFHPLLYKLALYAGGFWVTSKAFKEVHDKQKNYLFLTLPCSNLEKFISKLLLTSVGYVVGISICFYLVSLLIIGVYYLLVGFQLPFFNVLRPDILNSIYNYIILQSIFLLGSIYFRSNSLSKTVLLLIGFFIVMFISVALLDLILLHPIYIYNWFYIGKYSAKAFRLVFNYILAPGCWIITYFRLKEAEA